MESRLDDPFSVGYRIHINMVLDEESKKKIHFIAEKRGLAMRQVKGELIVYKPKQSEKLTLGAFSCLMQA